MSFFDFSDLVERAIHDAKDDPTRWSARTTIGRQEFPSAVRRAGLNLLQHGELFDPRTRPRALLIGVATWSDPDMNDLDNLVRAAGNRKCDIYVIDVDDCGGKEDIETFMPGVGSITRTPFVAQYRQSELVYFGQGQDALALLEQY